MPLDALTPPHEGESTAGGVGLVRLHLRRELVQIPRLLRRNAPELLAAAYLTGWPLVYDASVTPCVVHCRPSSSGAVEPPTPAEIGDYLRALMPSAKERP